jgi:hypothetical protein
MNAAWQASDTETLADESESDGKTDDEAAEAEI